MEPEVQSGRHYGIGPVGDRGGHESVTTMYDAEYEPEHGHRGQSVILFCLDCGFVTADPRAFAFEDCQREDNTINTTWRERVVEQIIEAVTTGPAGE